MILASISLIAIYALEAETTGKTAKKSTISSNAVIAGETAKPIEKIPVAKWQIPAAAYRLTIKSTKPELPGYIDLTRYCLPGTITKRIEVRSSTGKKIPFKLFSDHSILIDATPQSAIRHIYFGFNTPKTAKNTEKKTKATPVAKDKSASLAGARLKLTVINGRLNYLTGKEWIKEQQKRITMKYDRREKYYYKTMNQYLQRGIIPRIEFVAMQSSWWDPQLTEQLQALDKNQQYNFTWRPINNHTINISKIRSHNLLLYYSLSNYSSNIGWRVRALKKLPASRKKQLEKLSEQVKTAPEKAFIKLFNPKQKRWKRMTRGVKAVTEINLERRPFDARRNFGAIFSGKLIIPKTGEYQFAINSTSSVILNIDGKNIFQWLGAHNPDSGWGKIIKLSLKAGLHEFKFYYHKASGFTHATVAWQPPATATFSIMNENNFAPGWINQPQQCSAVDGTNYPLIKRTARQLLFIGKRQRAVWTNFKLLSDDTQNYTWQFNDKTLPNSKELDIIFNTAHNEKVTFTDTTNKASSLQLKPMPNTDKLSSINPDVLLKLWLPTFIYDDELLNGQIEISSNLPEKITCSLKIKASRENAILPTSVKQLVIPAKPLAKQAKFASNSMIKSNLTLNGAKLTKPLKIGLSLELPGIIFDQQQLSFIPLQVLPQLEFNGEYLTDQDGNRVIPVLHRPTLSELRSWELPSIIQQQLHKIKKITLIADDFGTDDNMFVTAMKNSLAKCNIKLTANSWHQQPNGFTMLNSLPGILMESDNIDSDTIIIIPPTADFNGIASVRLQGRTIAAIIEQLQNNPKIRNIYLTTPFPTPTAHNESIKTLTKTLQKLCRTYNIQFIDLNSYIKTLNNWKSSYSITPGNSAVIAAYPIQLAKESADFIIKKMVK